MQLAEPSSSWLLESNRSSSIDQLAGTQGSSLGSQDLSGTENLNHSHQNGQRNQFIVYQQARWNSFSPIIGTSDRSLELVSSPQYNDPGPAYLWNLQHNSGHRVSSNLLQESMADQTFCIRGTQQDMGSFYNRSLRRPNNEIVAKFWCSLLTQRDLVSSANPNGLIPSIAPSSSSGSNDISQDDSLSTLSELDALRVAIIRNKLVKANLNEQAIQDLLTKNWLPIPLTRHIVSYTAFSGADLVATLKTVRAAAARLHDSPSGISEDSLINSYLDTLSRQALPDSNPSRTTMTAFLRPSDLARIPFSSCEVGESDGCLKFQDQELCPVQCFKALRDHSDLQAHPENSTLFIKSNNIRQPLSANTLSSWLHREFISLSTSGSRISIRSLASSRALDQGVSMGHIVTLDNWVSPGTFQDHYQRNQMAMIVFTSTPLSGSNDDVRRYLNGVPPRNRPQHFIENWKKMTTQTWPLSVIQDGYKIQFNSKPISWTTKTYKLSESDQQAVNKVVDSFLKSKVIERSPTQDKRFLSQFFTIKEPNKIRPILDCRKINQFIQCNHFKMEGVPALRDIVEKDDFLTKIDLKDAYIVVPIHPESWKFLSFSHKGTVYQYRSLTFGQSVAPHLFSKLMRHALEPLRAIGIRLVYYPDDICVVARTKEEMEDHTQKILTQLTNLGLLGFYVQHKNNENQHSANQDIETDFTDKTTAEEQATIFLLMDCWSFGENDSNDPSNWRSIASCGTYTKGSSDQPSPEQPKLGEKLPDVNSEFEETRLVEEPSIAVEWPPDHTQGSERTRCRDFCGCLGHGMGCDFHTCRNSWTLEKTRKRSFDQSEGAEANPFCLTAPRKRVRRWGDQDILRQCNSSKIRQKIRRDSLPISARTRSRNTRGDCYIQPTSSISAHTRNQKRSSRRIKSKEKTTLRMEVTTTFLQEDSRTMEAIEDQCVRNKSKHKIKTILGSESRPTGRSNQRMEATMVKDRDLSAFTMEINPKGSEETESRQSQDGCTYHTQLAEPILVANGFTSEHSKTINLQSEQTMVLDRMEVIRAYQLQIENLTEVETLGNIVFGTQTKGESFRVPSDKNTIASVFRIIHPDKPAIASNLILQQYFQARKRNHYKLPNNSQEIYDIQPIIDLILIWDKTVDLSLYVLQKKAILLTTIASMWRPRSDIGKLQYRDVNFKQDDQGLLQGVTLTARSPKEIEAKSSKLGALKDREICPAYTLWHFCQRTKHLRTHLAENHSLLLANILEENGNKSRPISLVTIANWIKDSLKEAGINTDVFKAHSLRSAANTKAISNGASIHSVRMHANWSLNSDTFEKYYYRPRDQYVHGRTLTMKVFEPLPKTEDVVATCPWYKRWF
ncbi:hypothetical protein G6F52_001971 [Rhizopus delemar]|uniref:Reverse transcriptase domain-containing protein n=1 Tax=Rhizopus delemar TaxID=936053 RepID=A0A9P7CMV7_9FUNG|nr:hypothetical protein G6F52_001971 [Rhizopus delemar]KAG1568188.1 hypothetical protein G6F50_007518 [Rhizopus delemar]